MPGNGDMNMMEMFISHIILKTIEEDFIDKRGFNSHRNIKVNRLFFFPICQSVVSGISFENLKKAIRPYLQKKKNIFMHVHRLAFVSGVPRPLKLSMNQFLRTLALKVKWLKYRSSWQ